MATEYMTMTIKREEALPKGTEDLRKTYEDRLSAIILKTISDYEGRGWTYESREESPIGTLLRFKRES